MGNSASAAGSAASAAAASASASKAVASTSYSTTVGSPTKPAPPGSSDSFNNMADLQQKDPELYNIVMTGMAQNAIIQMSDELELEKQAMKRIRDPDS